MVQCPIGSTVPVPVPVSDVCGDLLELFAGVPVRVALALAAAAVVAGMKGYTAITGSTLRIRET